MTGNRKAKRHKNITVKCVFTTFCFRDKCALMKNEAMRWEWSRPCFSYWLRQPPIRSSVTATGSSCIAGSLAGPMGMGGSGSLVRGNQDDALSFQIGAVPLAALGAPTLDPALAALGLPGANLNSQVGLFCILHLPAHF